VDDHIIFTVNNAVTDHYRINNYQIMQINKIIVRVPLSAPSSYFTQSN